jgi:hypothetical protein
VLRISVLPLSMYWLSRILVLPAWYRHSSKNKVVGFWLILQHSSRFPR